MEKVNLLGKKVSLEFAEYHDGTIYIAAIHEGERYLDLTVNWSANWGGALPYGRWFKFPTVVLKNYSENEGVVHELEKAGVIEPGGAYLGGSGGTVMMRKLTDKWQQIALKQLK